jgi:hypothetical protein
MKSFYDAIIVGLLLIFRKVLAIRLLSHLKSKKKRIGYFDYSEKKHGVKVCFGLNGFRLAW